LKSEFGKGLVVNLVKFGEHYSNDMWGRIRHIIFYQSKTKEERDLIISDNPPPEQNYGYELKNDIKLFLKCEYKIYGNFEQGISHLITLWANGATDHLYEIEAPKGKEWNKIRKLVEELKDKGLSMGHGFTNKIYVYDDVLELWDLTKKICILIDKKIGLKPDWGNF